MGACVASLSNTSGNTYSAPLRPPPPSSAPRGGSALHIAGLLMPLEAFVLLSNPFTVSFQVLSGLILILLLLALSTRNHIRRPPSAFLRGLGFVLASLVVSYGVAVFLGVGGQGEFGTRTGWSRPLIQLLERSLFVFVFAAALMVFSSSRQHADRFVRGFLQCSKGVIIYSTVSWFLGWTSVGRLPHLGNSTMQAGKDAVFHILGVEIPRQAGSFGEPKGYAWLLIVFIVLLSASTVTGRQKSGGRTGWWTAIASFAIVTTFSTAGLLLLGPALIASGVIRSKGRVSVPLVSIAVTVTLAVALAAVSISPPAISTESSSMAYSVLEDRLNPDRYDYVAGYQRLNIGFVQERPLLGHGLGSQSLLTQPDSPTGELGYAYPGFLLASLVERGLIGTLLLLVGLLMLFAHALRKPRTGWSRATVALGVLWLVRGIEFGILGVFVAATWGLTAGLDLRMRSDLAELRK